MPSLRFRAVRILLIACGVTGIGFGLWSTRESWSKIPLPRLGGTAKIVAIPAEIDFQAEKRQSNRTVEIVLRNEGGAAGTLLGVKTTCGCTSPQMPASNVIEPGAETRLSIKVQPPPYGSKDSTVTIQTDSDDTPSIRVLLHLHGQKLLPPYVSHAPQEIRVESVYGEVPAARKFQVNTVESPGEPWLTGFRISNEAISLGEPQIIREIVLDESTLIREYEAEITFGESASSDSDLFADLIPTTRSEPVRPFPPVAVKWRRVSAIRAAPASVLMIFSGEAAESTRKVVLVGADDFQWKIESIEADVPWLTAVPEERRDADSPNQLIQVTAARPAEWDGSLQQGRISVHTDHPQCPDVVIRVTASEPQG